MSVVHTMAEEIELAKTPMAAAVLRGVLEPSQVWDKLPVKTVRNLEVKNRRWKSIPTPAFAHIGESYGSGGGKTEAVSFGLKLLGHDLDIPKIYDEDTDHIVDPKALNVEMTLMGLSFMLTDTLFNGDMATNPRSFDGLKKVSADLPARQTMDAALAANGGDGTSLDIRSGGASDTIRHAVLDIFAKCHRRLDNVPGQSASGAIMVMNENFLDLFESIVRRAQLYSQDTDRFERTVAKWRGMPFVDAGFADIDGDSLILADDHDVPGAATPTTSVYFLLLDAEKHIGVLQLRSLDVRSLGELQDNAVNRYRLDWPMGVVVWGKRSLVRAKGFRVGT